MGKKWDVIDITMLCLTFYEPPIVQHEVFLAYKYVVIVALFVKYCKEIKAIWKNNFSSNNVWACNIDFYGGKCNVNKYSSGFFYIWNANCDNIYCFT